MFNQARIEALHRRLKDERLRIVASAADVDAVPAANLLAYLADIDGAAAAIEAVLQDHFEARSRHLNGASLDGQPQPATN